MTNFPYAKKHIDERFSKLCERFKSITVNENTFNQVDRLTETLLPGAKLSELK